MRRPFLICAVGAFAIGLGAPALAIEDNARAARDAASNQAADSADPDRMICVRAQLTGSRLYRRVCRTAREWQEDGEVPGQR